MNTKFDGAGRSIAIVAAGQMRLDNSGGAVVPARGPAAEAAKRTFDVVAALLALPFVGLVMLVLLLANPIWNPGPLFFRQTRMGKSCKPFTALKFRTMRTDGGGRRGPDDPLEHERITPLGRFLRRSRLDEIPQFTNILKGEMSLIGPRPDFWDHAIHYLESVPGYRERHVVRPGITGLAQVHLGYAEGLEATFRKVHYDIDYIRTASFWLELRVLWRTVLVVTSGFGAR